MEVHHLQDHQVHTLHKEVHHPKADQVDHLEQAEIGIHFKTPK
jgi:hypothetical protein